MHFDTEQVPELAGPPTKVSRWLVAAAGAGLVLFPPVWLVVERLRADARVVAGAAASEFDRQIELARTLLDAGKARESLIPLERSRRLSPEAFAVHNNLCVAHGLLEQRDDALAACSRAIAIDPQSQLARNNLAWVTSIHESETR